MNEFYSLVARNKEIAAHNAAADHRQRSLAEALPEVKAIIIGCADMRVDPAHILGLRPGEAVVMRNIGGRVTPGLLSQLGMLGRIGQVVQKIPGGSGEFHIVVLQHTDCGITRLADESAMLSSYFEMEPAELDAKSVIDPRAAVAVDVAALRGVPGLPANWLLSGLVYDLGTGLVDVVEAPKPIGA